MKPDPRYSYAYRKARARLKARAKRQGAVCWICREPIDYTLPYTDARSFTADHVNPLAKGGPILGPLRPAHRSCNSSRGDGTRETRLPTTRQW